jgi:hypothetical protein
MQRLDHAPEVDLAVLSITTTVVPMTYWLDPDRRQSFLSGFA